MWRYTSKILARGRWRQEDLEFEDMCGYRVRSYTKEENI
jgi:hypothetical protein